MYEFNWKQLNMREIYKHKWKWELDIFNENQYNVSGNLKNDYAC